MLKIWGTIMKNLLARVCRLRNSVHLIFTCTAPDKGQETYIFGQVYTYYTFKSKCLFTNG
jgi:hypothetical protein